MALSLQSATLVRQKTRAFARNPMIFYALKAFFHYHAQRGNRDLEIVYVDDTDITGTDGVVVADAAAVVYVAFIRKPSTATDAYFKLFDNATVDTTAGDGRVVIPLLEASEDNILVFPQGLDMAAGVVATSHTTYSGSTDSTAGDAGYGFVIIGASGTD